eukprot:3408882-Rhodomonas_salina.1
MERTDLRHTCEPALDTVSIIICSPASHGPRLDALGPGSEQTAALGCCVGHNEGAPPIDPRIARLLFVARVCSVRKCRGCVPG